MNPKDIIIASVKLGYILFGSSKSNIMTFLYHSDDPEFQRDYVYGNGMTGQAEIVLRTQKFGRLTGNINRWIIYTKRDTKGTEDLMLVFVEYHYPVWRKLSIGFQGNYYRRSARYDKYSAFLHIKNSYYETKLLGVLNF